MTNPYVLITGDIVQTGGMDAANYALTSYLARSGADLHLVAYRVAPELIAYSNVTVHRVVKPANAYMLGGPVLAAAGLIHSRRLASRGARVIANGGNCPVRGVNWVHYVHAAYETPTAATGWRKTKHRVAHRLNTLAEKTALRAAQVVIANSERTRRQVIDLVGVDPERTHTVYYGVDASKFRPHSPQERLAMRASLGWSLDIPRVVFIGGLGDRRKGFDTLFAAWQVLCRESRWDANLVVIGAGTELSSFRARAKAAGIAGRIDFLGFRSDVPNLLAACDALVSPTRYEAYGLGIHEALCCGLPAIVSASSGIAERYPSALRGLLLPDPEDVQDLAQRLRSWRGRTAELRADVSSFGASLRSRSWDDMAREIAGFCG